MVSTVSILFIAITAIFCILLPFGLALYFLIRQKAHWISILTGMAVFIFFQLMIRLPLLQIVLPNTPLYGILTGNIWLYTSFLGFSASLAENLGRYLAFSTILRRRHLDWKNGVGYGIGHGGIEAAMLVGMSYVSNFFICLSINAGRYDSVIAPTLSANTASLLKSQLIDTPSYMFLIPGLERGLTLLIQIGLALIVMEGIRKGKGLLYLLYAFLIHGILDTSAGLLAAAGLNVWLIELYVALYAAAALLFIVRTRQNEKNLTSRTL